MSTKSILKLSYLSFYDSTCLCLNYLFYGLLGCSFLAVVMINYPFFTIHVLNCFIGKLWLAFSSRNVCACVYVFHLNLLEQLSYLTAVLFHQENCNCPDRSSSLWLLSPSLSFNKMDYSELVDATS